MRFGLEHHSNVAASPVPPLLVAVDPVQAELPISSAFCFLLSASSPHLALRSTRLFVAVLQVSSVLAAPHRRCNPLSAFFFFIQDRTCISGNQLNTL
jgi:hypothetical protein